MDVFSENSRESPSAAAGNEAESRQEERRDAREQIYLDTCPVCHLNFHSRDPKLLPCLHSFCKKCLPPPSNSSTTRKPSKADGDIATKPRESLCVQTMTKDRCDYLWLCYFSSKLLLYLMILIDVFFLPVPVNVISCPLCRQECTAGDVMDNVFVKDSAEAPCSSTVDKTVQVGDKGASPCGGSLVSSFKVDGCVCRSLKQQITDTRH